MVSRRKNSYRKLRGPSGFMQLKSRGRCAFTLLEILVVVGIIAILLVATLPAVNSLSKSNARKGAISNLLGVLEQARAQAVKDGQATYVIFPTFSSGTQTTKDRYHYKSYAVFQEDPANTLNPKQVTSWKTMPTGVALRAKAGNKSVTDLPNATSLIPPKTFEFTPESGAKPTLRFIKFNSNGEVELPATNVSLAIFEGFVDGTAEVITGSKDSAQNPRALETLTIARLTGRATRSP